MSDETITTRLQELQNDNRRSLAARFRNVYPWIEAALQAGHTHRTVHSELHKAGLYMTLNLFRKYLHETRALYRNPASEIPLDAANSNPPKPPPPLAAEITLPAAISPSTTPQTKGSTTSPPQRINPFDASDPRSLDHIVKQRRNLDQLEAIGKAQRKVQNK